MIQAHGLGALLYSPLAGGLLTGKYRKGEQGRLSTRGDTTESTAQQTSVIDEVLAIASELERTPVEISLAWLRRRSTIAQTALIPIVGPRTVAHLNEYLSSLDLELHEQHYERLNKVSMVQLGKPHDDVAAALNSGLDGDRGLLDAAAVPVI